MGVPADLARGSLRFTLGHTSAATDVEALAAVIGPVVERARAASAAERRRDG
jgi:cysteine desulfurase